MKRRLPSSCPRIAKNSRCFGEKEKKKEKKRARKIMKIQHFYLSLFHFHTLMLFIIQSSLLHRHFSQFSACILLLFCSSFPGDKPILKEPMRFFIRVSYPRETSTLDQDEKRNLFEAVLCDSTKGGLPVFQS